jgi:hypothetical protein
MEQGNQLQRQESIIGHEKKVAFCGAFSNKKNVTAVK